MAIQSVEVNVVDVLARRTFAARVTFGSTILDIVPLGPTVGTSAPPDSLRLGRCTGDNVLPGLPYAVPGFVDAHVHIESSLLSPQHFAAMVLPYGTLGVVADPHEIANVLGLKGIQLMMDDAARAPFRLAFAAPSCVPATSMETNGARLEARQLARILPRCVALAEMMNYPGVVNADPTVMAKIALARQLHKPIDGHAPRLTGDALRQYVAAGISTDHECSSAQEAEEKLALGMNILVREGSAARNLKELLLVLLRHPERCMVCTDDVHTDFVREQGHLLHFLHRLRQEGMTLYDIYRPMLLNAREHYHLSVGRLQKGDRADFLLVDDLQRFDIRAVYVGGRCVVADGKLTYKPGHTPKSNRFCERELTPAMFRYAAPTDNPLVRVIEVEEGQLHTRCYLGWRPRVRTGEEIRSHIVTVPSTEAFSAGASESAAESATENIVKLAVVNRYDASIPVSLGYVKGTGMHSGALATSIAHDSHNVIVLGVDAESMCFAAREVFRRRGGMVVVAGRGAQAGAQSPLAKDTDVNTATTTEVNAATTTEVERKSQYYVVAALSLPIAGLMTSQPAAVVEAKYRKLVECARSRCGLTLASPFMTLGFLSLLVIPALKLGDRGLFDVERWQFVKLCEGDDRE